MASRHLIQPPARSSIAGSLIIAASFLVFSIIPFSSAVRPWIAAVALLLTGAAFIVRDVQAFQFAFLVTLVAGVRLIHPILRAWPFSLLVPIALFLALTLAVPALRGSLLKWLRPGRVDRQSLLWVLGIAIIAGIALYLWHALLRPDVAVHLRHFPSMSRWFFPIAGLGFAFANAAMEEFVFRGVVMQSLDSALGPGLLSILGQAWLFGAMHYLQGFPNGVWGTAMASAYGLMLGLLRRRSHGMFAPWLAHICADLVIFAILARILLNR